MHYSMMSLRNLDFHEALKDSPRFREQLSEHEQYFSQLERHVRAVLRQCATMVEYGKGHVAALYNMVEAMKELNTSCFANDPSMCSAFGIVLMAFEEVMRLQKTLVEHAHWSLSKRLNEFLTKELAKATEMRAHLNRVSDSLDEALVRNAGASGKDKQHKDKESAQAVDAHNELVAVGTCFSHTALDYVFHLNSLHAKDAPEILETFLSFIRAAQTHFTEGQQFFAEWQRDETYVVDSIGTMQQTVKQAERKMQDRHMLVPKDVFHSIAGMPPDPDVVMEGYLFKRSSNAFKTWNRRWFVVRENRLLYRTRDTPNGLHELKHNRKCTDDGYVVMEPELRVCLVRDAPASLDRSHCFELVTPNKTHTLQADSAPLCRAWMKALQRTIESALHDETPTSHHRDASSMVTYTSFDDASSADTSTNQESPVLIVPTDSDGGTSLVPAIAIQRAVSSPAVKKKMTDELYSIAGNGLCADCGAGQPKWASINLGVLLCIECCGIHRSLGVQVSKVRSTQLDAWEPEQIRLMQSLGNTVVNGLLLRHMPDHPVPPPPKPNAARAVRDAWIHAKYVERRFASRPAERAAALAKAHGIQQSKQLHVSKRSSLLADVLQALEERERRRSTNEDDSPRRSLSLGGLLEPLDGSVCSRHASSPCLNEIDGDAGGRSDLARLQSCGSDPLLEQTGEHHVEHEDELNRSMSESDRQRQIQLLLRAASQGDVADMYACVLHGADVNARVPMNSGQQQQRSGHEHTTALHQACASGSAEAVEYLLLNNAKLNVVDSELDTPLHLAVRGGHSGLVCQLVRRGACADLRNGRGHTPLDIAVDQANADVVTLLRLSKLREEVIALEPMNTGIEETMSGVLEDISRQANSQSSSARSNQ